MLRATNPQLPSNFVIPDTLKCAVVLEAVKDEPSVERSRAHPWTASVRAGGRTWRSGRGKACGAVELEKSLEEEDRAKN